LAFIEWKFINQSSHSSEALHFPRIPEGQILRLLARVELLMEHPVKIFI